MAKQVWICDGCKRPNRFLDEIWNCPGCEIECCERCFSQYAHCKNCTSDAEDAETLRLEANAAGWDFEP